MKTAHVSVWKRQERKSTTFSINSLTVSVHPPFHRREFIAFFGTAQPVLPVLALSCSSWRLWCFHIQPVPFQMPTLHLCPYTLLRTLTASCAETNKDHPLAQTCFSKLSYLQLPSNLPSFQFPFPSVSLLISCVGPTLIWFMFVGLGSTSHSVRYLRTDSCFCVWDHSWKDSKDQMGC